MGYFVIDRNLAADFVFRFFASNNKQILSSESYTSKQNCQKGIEAVKRVAPFDPSYIRNDQPMIYRFNMISGILPFNFHKEFRAVRAGIPFQVISK